MQSIEVERRGFLSKERYESIGKYLLSQGAIDLSESNTKTVFFLLDDSQTKVQQNSSKRTAKIAWKSNGNDGSKSREEIELNIAYSDFDQSVKLFKSIYKTAQIFNTEQQRHDYKIDDIELAVKYSNDWSYHIELEIMINDNSDLDIALQKIDTLANKLQIELLTPEQEKSFVEEQIKKLQQE